MARGRKSLPQGNDMDMSVETFLSRLGWPDDRAQEAGQARWSGAGADGLSEVRATLSRDGSAIRALVASVSLDGPEEMLRFEARVAGGAVIVTRSQAGAPPQDIPAEDAAHLFSFMSSGLGRFKFASAGPLDLLSQKAAP